MIMTAAAATSFSASSNPHMDGSGGIGGADDAAGSSTATSPPPPQAPGGFMGRIRSRLGPQNRRRVAPSHYQGRTWGEEGGADDSSDRTPARRRGRGSTLTSSQTAASLAADFHPKLITMQIVAMQCFHYFFLALLFQINALIFGTSITIDRIFTDRYVRLWQSHSQGWADVAALLWASLAGAVLLAVIVEKSKKCLDFGLTLFILHVLLCTLYQGFPTVLDWWIVHVLGTMVMVLTGEYLCSRRELDDIPLLQL